jgi:hypothetical protein
MFHRLIEFVRFPAAYEGPILTGPFDGIAYVAGWAVTIAHLALAAGVLIFGFGAPWPTVSTVSSAVGTLFLITIVIVIHRRIGEHSALPRAVVWQWWLGPWDPVGRLVWLPVRLPEAFHAIGGRRSAPDHGP